MLSFCLTRSWRALMSDLTLKLSVCLLIQVLFEFRWYTSPPFLLSSFPADGSFFWHLWFWIQCHAKILLIHISFHVFSTSAPLLFSSAVDKLLSLSDEEWSAFLLQLCSSLEGQSSSTVSRSRLNLLCYLCCVVGHKQIATRLINSTLVGKLLLT